MYPRLLFISCNIYYIVNQLINLYSFYQFYFFIYKCQSHLDCTLKCFDLTNKVPVLLGLVLVMTL